jgi:quercetin dioxygenase-like cupin family protein
MKLATLSALCASLICLSVSSANAASAATVSANLPVTQLNFFATGVKTEKGELMAAAAFGDLGHAAHGTYVKMPAGFVSPVHTHTEDYYAVVISGVGVNGLPGSADVQLPAGSYWIQKGGEPHVTKCVSANECIFFINQPGKFDYVPSK